MRETGTGVEEYIELYDNKWPELMNNNDDHYPLMDYSHRSIRSMWVLFYNIVKKRDQNAARLLQIVACLDHRSVWYDLMSSPQAKKSTFIDVLPSWLIEVTKSKLAFNHAVQLLVSYSPVDVIGAGTVENGFSVHPVVHEWCSRYSVDARQHLCLTASIVLSSATPMEEEEESWLKQQRLLSHCDRVVKWVQEGATKHLCDPRQTEAQSEAFNDIG
jgi:hypothetical protein